MIKALIDIATNTLDQFVASETGHDLAKYRVVDVPEGASPDDLAWNGSLLVQRQRTTSEQSRDAMTGDALWNKLKNATPADVDAWLTTNVTTIAQSRRVLKFLLLAIRGLQDRNSL